MKQSPIFVRTYDFLLWLLPRTTKFPRNQRFVLAKAVQETALRFYETLIEAALADDKETALIRADTDLAKLRFYLRLCRDMELITPRQYHHVAEMVAEIGRLIGGWQRSIGAGRNKASRAPVVP